MFNIGTFPGTRLRRTRQQPWLRDLVQEHHVTVQDLIDVIFVIEGKNCREAVAELPGVERLSIDLAIERAQEIHRLGIPCALILPCIDRTLKDGDATEAFNPNGLLARSVKAIKSAVPDLGLMGDVALDLYTDHGHDGIFLKGRIVNDQTVEALIRQSVMEIEAGIDILAPSDMMDGRVGRIRQALEERGFTDALIFAHSAKFASALYGPYRDAVQSKLNLEKRDKRTYQQDPANVEEALREVALDISEGTDAVIAKPGTFYLDVISRIRATFRVPIIAFHVSGEYAMIKAAGSQGWIDENAVMMEAMVGFKRAGASAIITYAARQVAEALRSALGQN